MLIGWELGAGRGHAERLVPVIAAYRAKGWNVIAALRDARLGAEVLRPHQPAVGEGHLTIIRAPIFSHTQIERGPVHSLPEILAKTGFDKSDLVLPLIAGWEAILRRYRPDLVISDCAPSLNIATRGRVPLIVIGNGWTIPPDIDPPPAFVALSEGNRSVHDAANAVLSAMSAVVSDSAVVSCFADLLRGDLNIVCSLDETDPYRSRRTEPLHWPFEIAAPTTAPVDGRSGGLIYLPKNHPARVGVVRQAAHLNLPFEAFFNDVEQVASPNMIVHGKPIDFESIIPQKRVVIHHGGLGTAVWCMANQVPQVILPVDLEKFLIARGVVEGGFGLALSPGAAEKDLSAVINAALELAVPHFKAERMATLSPCASIETLISARFD